MPIRSLLRIAAGLMALSTFVLWGLLVLYIAREAGWIPAPAVFMLPIFFFSLAVWGIVAAVRDEPLKLTLAGIISFLPIGFYLLFMPGFARWIGILNLGVIALGIALLREPGAPNALEAAGAGPSHEEHPEDQLPKHQE
jgi:hypothetical protein